MGKLRIVSQAALFDTSNGNSEAGAAADAKNEGSNEKDAVAQTDAVAEGEKANDGEGADEPASI
jgi:hypothetical protein